MSSVEREPSAAALREEVIRLGPWHIDIEVTPEVSTRAFLDAPAGTYPESFGKIGFYDPREGFLGRLRRMFPRGLEGRSVLDCACNCGAHLLYAKDSGAGRCLGFDVRDHWIEQARFLARHRKAEDVRFEVADLYELSSLDTGPFEITLFFGIFYHLPDPVTGLKLAAGLTEELLLLKTATKAGHPDGSLVFSPESPTQLMSGTYGISWFPTGPRVLTAILNWLGFPEVRCAMWRHGPKQRDDLDLLQILAARTPGYFDAWDAARPDGAPGIAEAIETCTPPGSTVLVIYSDGPVELHSRTAIHVEADRVQAQAERLRAQGGGYLAVPAQELASLGGIPGKLPAELGGAEVVLDDATCRVYALHAAGEESRSRLAGVTASW